MNKVISKALIAVVLLAFAVNGWTATIDDSQWHGGCDSSWYVNFDKALAESKRTSRPLFVLHTSTILCIWCKSLTMNVLTTQQFKDFAAQNLVLLFLDDPMDNTLPASQEKHNDLVYGLLDFESNGMPCAVIYTSSGKKLGSIEGYLPNYIAKIKAIISSPDRDLAGNGRDSQLFTKGAAKLLSQGILAPTCGTKSATAGGLTWYYNQKHAAIEIKLSDDEAEIVYKRMSNPSIPCIPCDTAGKLEIPSELGGRKVVSIARFAFRGCKQLTSVSFPASMRHIKCEAFSGCSKIKAFEVAPGNTNFTSKAGVLYSADMSTIAKWPPALPVTAAFAPSVMTIGDSAFFEHSMTRFTVPKGIVTIDEFAFLSCRSLKSIAFKGIPSVIGTGAFCKAGLKTIEIPEGVVRIDHRAFDGCDKLESVVFPASLKELGGYAVFRKCTSLKKIVFKGDAPHLYSGESGRFDMFKGANPKAIICVSPKSKGWSNDGSATLPSRWPKGSATTLPIKYGK